MDTKEIKITVPDGYEIDKENSTLECIKFKKKEKLTYEAVCDALFYNKDVYFISDTGNIEHTDSMCAGHICASNNATSKRQLEQLLAINKLMNVAAYLNEKPLDWNNEAQIKWGICYIRDTDELRNKCNWITREALVYFDSEEHAKQAVEILGKDVVKLALGVFD